MKKQTKKQNKPNFSVPPQRPPEIYRIDEAAKVVKDPIIFASGITMEELVAFEDIFTKEAFGVRWLAIPSGEAHYEDVKNAERVFRLVEFDPANIINSKGLVRINYASRTESTSDDITTGYRIIAEMLSSPDNDIEATGYKLQRMFDAFTQLDTSYKDLLGELKTEIIKHIDSGNIPYVLFCNEETFHNLTFADSGNIKNITMGHSFLPVWRQDKLSYDMHEKSVFTTWGLIKVVDVPYMKNRQYALLNKATYEKMKKTIP